MMPVPTEQRPRLPWVYAGSHNLTRSAWGALEKDGAQFRMTNYECGVVLLPKNYIDWMNGDLASQDHPQGLQEDDLCEPIDLPSWCPTSPTTPRTPPSVWSDLFVAYHSVAK